MERRLDETTEHRRDHEAAQYNRIDQSTPLRNHLRHVGTLKVLLAEKRNVIMLVASLIATLSFTAAMNPPGGVWQDDSSQNLQGSPVPNPHKAGDAVMAFKHPHRYAVFYIANSTSMVVSLLTILLLICDALVSKNNIISAVLIFVLIGCMCLTIITVYTTVAASIRAITPFNFLIKEIRTMGITFVIILIIWLVIFLFIASVVVKHVNADQGASQPQDDGDLANEEARQIQLT